MKRISIILFLCLFAVFLSACTQGVKTDTAEHCSFVIDRIMQRGELVLGTAGSMPPLNMTTKAGEVIGIEIDIARAMADSMGVTLRIETMSFHELLDAVETGKVDMVLSAMTMTPVRNLQVAFVGPYFLSGKAFLTKRKTIASVTEATEINSPDTILTALKGSTSQYFVDTALPKAELITANDYDEAVNLVLQDKVHALVADYPICVISTFRYPDQGLVPVLTPLTFEPYGIALPGNDPLLVNWVENFIGMLEGSGQLEEIKLKWFKDRSWLKQLP
jgi:polar amino acid transport system substrate-binding protein